MQQNTDATNPRTRIMRMMSMLKTIATLEMEEFSTLSKNLTVGQTVWTYTPYDHTFLPISLLGLTGHWGSMKIEEASRTL